MHRSRARMHAAPRRDARLEIFARARPSRKDRSPRRVVGPRRAPGNVSAIYGTRYSEIARAFSPLFFFPSDRDKFRDPAVCIKQLQSAISFQRSASIPLSAVIVYRMPNRCCPKRLFFAKGLSYSKRERENSYAQWDFGWKLQLFDNRE